LLVAAVAALVVAPSALAAKPVPSLTPAATQTLWRAEVARAKAHPRVLHDAACRPARAIFYAQTDWMRLVTKLAQAPSPCAEYYVSVPPLAADKSQARANQAGQIRALGPQYHAVDEISWNGWSSWVSANASTWYEAGVTARQRMAAAGFDASAGDTWGLNELSSAVRANTGVARANALEFMRGLASDGVKGVVFVAGMAQSTADTGAYKVNLQNWLTDDAFWSAASNYASDWAQENYGDIRDYAVAGTTPDERRDAEVQYLGHELTLANANPDAEAASRSFLASAYVPFGNAAWAWSSAYGWTAAPVATMQDFVSGQVYAARSLGAAVDRLGFAWAPSNTLGLTTTDYNAQTASVLDRIATAIRDSAVAPDAACGTFCATTLDGAAFTRAWSGFGTWSTTTLGFGPASSFTAGSSVPVTVTLRQAGVPQIATSPVSIAFSSSSAQGSFSAQTATIPAGGSSVTVDYTDTQAGSPTITASADGYPAVSQVETVAAGPSATLLATPASSSLTAGQAVAITLVTRDAYGNAAAPVAVTATTTSPRGAFSGSGPTVSYSDTLAGSPTLTFTASGLPAVTLTETVDPAALAKLTLAPASATVSRYGSVSFTAAGTDAYGNRVVAAPAWSLSSSLYGTLVRNGSSATFTAGGRTGTVALTADDGTVRASATITIRH
jgi:hypothetical protein